MAAIVRRQHCRVAEPQAQAYAGQQFGGFEPQLSDGSGLLLGEVISVP